MSSKRLLSAVETVLDLVRDEKKWSERNARDLVFGDEWVAKLLKAASELERAYAQVDARGRPTWAAGHDAGLAAVTKWATEKLEQMKPLYGKRPEMQSWVLGRESVLQELLDVAQQQLQGQECVACGLPFSPWTVNISGQKRSSTECCLACDLSADPLPGEKDTDLQALGIADTEMP